MEPQGAEPESVDRPAAEGEYYHGDEQDVKESITSHEVPESISPGRSCNFAETEAACPAQVTIEVEETHYDPGATDELHMHDESQVNSSNYHENVSFKDSVVLSGKRKVSPSRIQSAKKINTGNNNDVTDACIKDEHNNYSCFFCKMPFLSGLKVMHIVLSKLLPSSSLDPLSLLQCFGMEFPISQKVDPTGFSPVDICGKCYVVILDCDFLYPHLHSAVSKILEVWPEKMDGMKTLSLNVTFSGIEDGDSCVPSPGRGKAGSADCFKHKSSLHGDNKLSLPDVQLSFSYARGSDLATKSRSSVRENEDAGNRLGYPGDVSRKAAISEIFTCGFCGVAFGSEEEWSSHLTVVHKIVQKWQSYNLQAVLKRCISKEVHWNDNPEQKRRAGADERRCYACNSDFQNKDRFLDHLHDYHNMVFESTEILNSYPETDALPEVHCKVEKDDSYIDDDRMSTCYSDGSASSANVGDLADVENEVREPGPKAKHRIGTRSSVKFAKEKGNETNVKKVYAPHWRCRICGMLFSSHEVLMRHRSQAHPEAARVIKKKIYDESYSRAPRETRVKMEVRCPVCNQHVESQEALREHLQVIHQKYMVVLDNQVPAPSERASGKEKARTPRKAKAVKVRSQPAKEDLGYCVVLKGDGQGGINDQRLKIDEELQEAEDKASSLETPVANPEVNTEEEKDTKKVTCGICGEEFGNRILMAEHSCSVREDTEANETNEVVGGSNEIVMLECKLCDRRLHGVNALRIHMARVHGDPNKKRQYRHRCKICPFQTRLRSQFYKHMKESHSIDVQPPVKCFVCGKMYNSQYINRHIAVVHGTTSNKKYSCKFCDMKYHDLVYLKRHVYFDHANTKWKCQVCHQEFEKYHQLRQHRVNVHGTKVHKCVDCEKTFKRKGDLTTHRKRRHEAKVPSVCSFCSKAYSEPSKLRVHLIEKHGVPWENTLSQRYARHQQENNCLKRHTGKDGKMSGGTGNPEGYVQHRQIRQIRNESGFHRSDSSYEEEESEEDFHQAAQHEYSEVNAVQHYSQGEIVASKGEVITAYGTTQVSDVPESDYNVVEVTETEDNMGNIGEISYIIYEESNN